MKHPPPRRGRRARGSGPSRRESGRSSSCRSCREEPPARRPTSACSRSPAMFSSRPHRGTRALVRPRAPALGPGRGSSLEPARRNSGPAAPRGGRSVRGRRATRSPPPSLRIRRSPTPTPSAARSPRRRGRRTPRASSLLAARPTRPETDFGYLELEDGRVERFTVKPLRSRKPREFGGPRGGFLLERGDLRLPSFAAARRSPPRRRRPLEGVERFVASGRRRRTTRRFPRSPSTTRSWRRSGRVRAVRLDAGWNDVGTWRSVRELRGASDPRGISSCRIVRCSRPACATPPSSSATRGSARPSVRPRRRAAFRPKIGRPCRRRSETRRRADTSGSNGSS